MVLGDRIPTCFSVKVEGVSDMPSCAYTGIGLKNPRREKRICDSILGIIL